MFLTIIFLCGLILYILSSYQKKFTLLAKYGISHPPTRFFFGNLKEYNSMPNVHWDSYVSSNFGKDSGISGYYLGTKPFVLITSQKIISELSSNVKISSLLLDRPRRIPGGISPDPKRKLMLGNLNVGDWKDLRKKMNHNFSVKNVKMNLVQISGIIDECMFKIEQNLNSEVGMDFYPAFQGLALDIISSSVFGVESNVQTNPNHPVLKAVVEEFSKSTNSWMITMILGCPSLGGTIQRARATMTKLFGKKSPNASALWNIGNQAYHQRDLYSNNNSTEKSSDFISNLIRAGVPPEKIIANTVLFFEAAYETLSSCLAYTVHLLVNNPKVQEKLCEELAGIELKSSGQQDEEEIYNSIKNLNYLENVIMESLRLLPPQTTFIGRAPSQDLVVEADDGKTVVLPKGIHLQIGLYQIQHSKKHWESPEEFIPERFGDNSRIPEGSKSMFQAFGFGQRMCIGHLYAKIVLKLTLAKIFSKYKLVPTEKTEKKITIDYKVATMTPKFGSWAKPVSILNN